MWKYSIVVLCWAAVVGLHGVGAAKTTNSLNGNTLSEYTISPSRQLAYYHYPTPSRGFQLPSAAAPAQHAQRAHAQQSPRYASNGYQTNYATKTTTATGSSLTSTISKQFSSPALEQAAFTMALTSQGYRFGAIPSSSASASTASSSSTSTSTTPQLQAQPQSQGRSSPQLPTASATVISSPDAYSLNVKLPLPLGSAPIKLGPLPLQAGAPYSSIPRGLTSYGTTHPLRRR